MRTDDVSIKDSIPSAMTRLLQKAKTLSWGTVGAAMGTDFATPELYIPPEIDMRDVAILNAVYGKRAPIDCVVAGFPARIAPAWADKFDPTLKRVTVQLLIDGAPAILLVDSALLGALIGTAGYGLKPARLLPEHAGLLLEFVLREALRQFEAAAGIQLNVLSIGPRPHHSVEDGISLRFALAIKQKELTWSWLTLPRSLAEKLAALLAKRKAPPAAVNTLVPLALRIGHVTLTASELRNLQPGDILLSEHACAPSTAAAVIAEHLVAPVELTAEGARLAGAPNLLSRSPLGWSGGSFPVADGAVDGARGSIPVRVFFELSRRMIAVSELDRLPAGTIFPTPRENSAHVDIVAAGRRIGRGEPVAVGESRGLRITRLFGNE